MAAHPPPPAFDDDAADADPTSGGVVAERRTKAASDSYSDSGSDSGAAPAAGASASAAAPAAAATRMPTIHDGEKQASTFEYDNPFLPPYTPAGDAALFREALAVDGGKKNVKMLIDLLTTRGMAQIQAARAEFDRASGKRDLVKWIKKRTRNNLERVLVALAYSQAEFDATQLHSALSGIGTRESVLIDVLTFRDNEQIAALKAKYLEMYQRSLESDIRGDTTGDFENILVALLQANRGDELAPLVEADVQSDAQGFQAATEARTFTTNDEFIIRLFTKRSHAHLEAVARAFARITKKKHRFGQSATHHFEETLTDETSGSYQKVLLALLHPQHVTAHLVHEAITGLGTDDKGLIAALVSANFSPLRMHLAKNAYVRLYNKHMVRDIESDTSGNYRRALRRLCVTHQGNLLAVILRENLSEATLWVGKTNKARVSAVLTEAAANPRERKDTTDAFFLDYGIKLSKSLKGALAADHAKFLIALSTERAVLDANAIKGAISGFGTAENVLIDVMTTRRPFEIEAISKVYEEQRSKTLIAALETDTSGNFMKVLRALAEGRRPWEPTITAAQADGLAQQLYEAGEKKTFGTKDDVFVSICTGHSPQDLALVDAAYMRLRNKSLEAAITKESSGHYRKALLACVNPTKFIAGLLRKTMKGIGTDDSELVRLLAHRPKEEVEAVKAAFLAEFKKPLGEWIKGDTSGFYRTALLSYIGDAHLIGSKGEVDPDGEHSADDNDDDPDTVDQPDAEDA